MRPVFITGNTNKLTEAQALIPELDSLDLDLTEIQEMEPRRIIEAKLRQARDQYDSPLIVEDISLFIESLNGLPGPLIKWFLKRLGAGGIARLCEGSEATARCMLGLYSDDIHFFEATAQGTIVAPRGTEGFGFDPIFVPTGSEKTQGEMSLDEKRIHSTRERAFATLRRHLYGKTVMVFGTFDVMHPGHLHFFKQARQYGGHLVAVAALDETVKWLKGQTPYHTEKQRLAQLRESAAVDTAMLGYRDNPYGRIQEMRPDVICLGHDQRAFVEPLQEFLDSYRIPAEVVRLKPYKRDVYRSSRIREKYGL